MADSPDDSTPSGTPGAAASASVPAGAAAPAAGADPDAEIVAALAKDPEGIRKLLLAKRGYNSELEGHRKTADGYKTQLEELQTARQKEIEDAENAKLSEQEKLTKELGKTGETLKSLQGQLTEREQENFNLRVQIGALRLGANDPEVVEFKLGKHLKTLDETARKGFGEEQLASWLAELKEKDTTGLFKPKPAEPSHSRPTPPGGGRPPEKTADGTVNEKLRNPRNHQEQAELNRDIYSIIRTYA